jgi:hypothetical protein
MPKQKFGWFHFGTYHTGTVMNEAETRAELIDPALKAIGKTNSMLYLLKM